MSGLGISFTLNSLAKLTVKLKNRMIIAENIFSIVLYLSLRIIATCCYFLVVVAESCKTLNLSRIQLKKITRRLSVCLKVTLWVLLTYTPSLLWCVGFCHLASSRRIVTDKLGIVAFTGVGLASLLAWTFTEYFLHRFVFHYKAKSRFGKYIIFLFHGIHHDDRRCARLVMPPVPAVIIVSGCIYF